MSLKATVDMGKKEPDNSHLSPRIREATQRMQAEAKSLQRQGYVPTKNGIPRQTLFRIAMLSAITEEDVLEIVDAVVQKAKNGSVPHASLILDRCVGRVDDSTTLRRLEELEEMVAALEAHDGKAGG